ncbi:ABATE domain-containing protein [Streptomyces sp. wa1063]|uniref:CGNR zinc finger domain-containing protein n=1 Tax=Streptomyces sp. wa1063 TaxID=1828212 RepID=UPI000BF050DF|nr:ABATE domain-containing protein [Streptomyces sp. wa1063]
MLIPHDTRIALDTVVDLVNTAPENELPRDEPSDGLLGGSEDGLADVAALYAFTERHLISGVGALGEKDLTAVRDVRARFAEVFAAPDPRAAADLVNRLVAAAGTTPQLTDHDGYDWHVHYFAPDASIADHLAADCGMALAFIIVAGEQERLRRCEAPDHSTKRSCRAAISSRPPITVRKIIRGGWESAKRQPRGSSAGGAGASPREVSTISG